MSNLQIIERLCGMLNAAQEIIRQQAELLELHGIETDIGELEDKRAALLKDIELST